MKQTRIISGNFAGEGSKGNFSGYNAKNERIFIHKRTMEAFGITNDEQAKAKLPFFALIDNREINLLDENGEVSDKKAVRLQALSLFADKASMIEAFNEESVFEIEAKVALATTAKSSGLSEKAVEALLEAAI